MPLSRDRFLEIIKKQAEQVEPRYKGWNDDVLYLVAEIVALERKHSRHRTTIEADIFDQINATAQLLIKNTRERAE